MNDIVLFCKSYNIDIVRLSRLWKSIIKHNKNLIPFFVSVPSKDLDFFKKNIFRSSEINWIKDEDIVDVSPGGSKKRYETMNGGISQQIIKAEFWRLESCKSYLCLDSDCKFIRDFSTKDFLTENGTPYTVIHQHKEFIQLALNRGKKKVYSNTLTDMRKVKDYMERKGVDYDFGPTPVIWHKAPWDDLYQYDLCPNGLTLWDAIIKIPNEIKWYGESLLKNRSIELYPIEPLMRVYHYYWDYKILKKFGENEEKLSLNYLGVIYQSNWEYETLPDSEKKSTSSLIVKKIKRLLA